MNPRFLVVLSFVVLASFASGKTIILSQTINVNGSAVNDTNNYLSAVSASNDSGSHTFRFAREGLSNLSVTINDQTGGGSGSGGNMSLWYIDADTGSTYPVLNETLVRILSGTGISTSIVGGDVFVENTGVINEIDPLSCHTDGSSCPAFVTYAGLNTVLNGQNNLSLLQIKNNLGNYTANPAGYYNITTLPTWAYNASYVTYTVLNGQANVSPASITGNLTSYPTNAALLANATAVNDSWKGNVTGYYPRNANPLGYINTTTTVDLSPYVNLTILNGQNNISGLSVINNVTAVNNSWKNNVTGYYPRDANPLGYLNTTYNASYATTAQLNTGLAGQWNVSPASITGNLSSYATNAALLANATAVNDSWKGNVTGYYPRNSNPLGYSNVSCVGSNSTYANVSNGSACIMVVINPGSSSGSSITRWVNVTTSNNQNITGVTLGNISGLEWVAVANNNYTFMCNIRYMTNASTSGISFAIEDWGGSVNSLRLSTAIFVVTATAGQWNETNLTGKKGFSTSVNAANTPYFTILDGIVYNGGSNVVITPQFSGEAAGLNAAVLKNSYCRVEAI